jgi:putative membrane protein
VRPRKPRLDEVGDEPDARFSLANERTFLAWNRTALALIAGGLAISQLLPPGDMPGLRRVLALPPIALGGVVGWTSYHRWDANERALRLGEPLPPSWLPRILALAVAGGAAVAVLLAIFGEQG